MSSPTLGSRMFRHPSHRYQKAKGLKVKHVVQIAMVTVVLTWVMYQLNQAQKHGHAHAEENISTISLDDLRKDSSLGRKGLILGHETGDSKLVRKKNKDHTWGSDTHNDGTVTLCSLGHVAFFHKFFKSIMHLI